MTVIAEAEALAARNIHQRLHAVMGEVSFVEKVRKDGMKYSVVLHDDVTALVRGPLLKNGVHYYSTVRRVRQDGNRTEIALSVVFVNIDNPSDVLVVESVGYGIDTQDKGPGKGISYATKYALIKTLGLASGDDPDKQQDIEHVPQSTYEKEVKPPPTLDPEKKLLHAEAITEAGSFTEFGGEHVAEWLKGRGMSSLHKADVETLNACVGAMKEEAAMMKEEEAKAESGSNGQTEL